MKKEFFFFMAWFRAMKRAIDIYSETQAKKNHENKLKYTVLVGSVESPSCFIDVTDSVVVVVGFLDGQLREILTYTFQEAADNRLFLTVAIYREFQGNSDEIVRAVSYIFGESGNLNMERVEMKPRKSEISISSVDVSHNFTEKPVFGEYDDLIRVERC